MEDFPIALMAADLQTRFIVPRSWIYMIPVFYSSQIQEIWANSKLISFDIPTVRAAFGWDYSFSSADEAYRDIKSSQENKVNFDPLSKSSILGRFPTFR